MLFQLPVSYLAWGNQGLGVLRRDHHRDGSDPLRCDAMRVYQGYLLSPVCDYEPRVFTLDSKSGDPWEVDLTIHRKPVSRGI